jgi:hypothetical protein
MWKYNDIYEFWINMDQQSSIQIDYNEKFQVYVVRAFDTQENVLILNNHPSKEEMRKWMNEWMQN